MLWIKRLLCLLPLWLGACDFIAQQELVPGTSTAAEVRKYFGPPQREWSHEDGRVTWEYSRQPEGSECYMVTLAPNGILLEIVQVLGPEGNLGRVTPGMMEAEVLRLLGKPGYKRRYAMNDALVWEWRIGAEGLNNDVFFTVSFDPTGRVREVGRRVDARGN